jgi:putative ABC transport system substrate-binding protein
MNRLVAGSLATLALVVGISTHAQTQKPPRVGVIYEGGSFNSMIDGFRDGLREQGLEPGKDVRLEIRDTHGDRAAAGRAGRELEQAGVDLLFTPASSVSVAVKAATTTVPIVFAVGGDAAALGFAATAARPAGRMSGVQYLSLDLTAKRFDVLRQMLPRLTRVVTLYDPTNPTHAIEQTRDAARRLHIQVVEIPVVSVAQLQDRFRALRPDEADAFFYTADAMIVSQAQFIIDTANAKKLPTMFGEESLVTQGALVSYGVNFHDVGRLTAKYAVRILAGAKPGDLPIESISSYTLVVNLKTARELGISIPQSVLLQTDKLVE